MNRFWARNSNDFQAHFPSRGGRKRQVVDLLKNKKEFIKYERKKK